MRISQKIIDGRYSRAKRKKYQDTIEEYGYIFCESCGVNESEGPIDCSHIISRDDCKKYDLLELIYDLLNLRWHCRACHHHWEDGTKKGQDTLENLKRIEFFCSSDGSVYEKCRSLLSKYRKRWLKHL